MTRSSAKPRILIIEEQPVLDDLATLVAASGCECVGPVLTVSAAIDTLEYGTVDAAIVNRDAPAQEFTDILFERRIPFAFAADLKGANEDLLGGSELTASRSARIDSVRNAVFDLLLA